MKDSSLNLVKFIRLREGDDIVSETVELGDEDIQQYMLINPLRAIYTTTPQNDFMKVVFVPWIFNKICDVQEFVIDKSDVLTIANVSESMNDYYWKCVDELCNEDKQIDNQDVKENISDEPENISAGKRTYH